MIEQSPEKAPETRKTRSVLVTAAITGDSNFVRVPVTLGCEPWNATKEKPEQ